LILRNSQFIKDIHSSISLMRSACLVRTRFILNNFSGIGLGVPGPPPPWLCPWSVPSIDNSSDWFAAERSADRLLHCASCGSCPIAHSPVGTPCMRRSAATAPQQAPSHEASARCVALPAGDRGCRRICLYL